uniref:Pectinesterase n=1 Tax=Kalanchoe fedtschenkoi TaxID=63787 RepID=A0A7N0UNQ6_KALFE
MAMASPSSSIPLVFLALVVLPLSAASKPDQTFSNNLSPLKSFCHSRPYPDLCYDSLKLSISININPNILNLLLQTLQNAITQSGKLTALIAAADDGHKIVERRRGTLQDCRELHQISDSYLRKSVSKIRTQESQNLADARAYLSAALTNKNTCLEGLETASGPLKPTLVDSFITTYKHVSNTLSMIPKTGRAAKQQRHEPTWLSRKDSDDEYDPSNVLTVAPDGSGNFTTISDAINFAPNMSNDRILIYVKEGVYSEYVDVPSYKTNIVLLGDGSDVTVVTGNRSMGDNWTTFRSATVAVSGEGFLARDMRFENTAGPAQHQAVALRVNADLVAFYRCSIIGFQDTLYVHSFRQFYRECDIYGTVDYIFGNAAVVIQASNIVSQLPLPGQFIAITAQSRETADEDTGISIQNCSILATEDLYSNSATFKTYLGRPWRPFARTVYLESYMDDFIDPAGWTKWGGGISDSDDGLATLYYGEYENYGPGSGTGNRVGWEGFHVMDYYDASNFTVAEFITGDEWLESTAFPYDNGI